MKIARVLLALAALAATAACGGSSITGPVERQTVQHRNNVGGFGSGWVAAKPDPSDPTLQE